MWTGKTLIILKHLGSRVLPTSDYKVLGSNSVEADSARDCNVLHCTEPFIITLPKSQYDLNNVERDIKPNDHI